MGLKMDLKDDVATAYLSGEIDHHSAAQLREAIDSYLQSVKPPVLKLDFKDVPFMDSSGIGLILGRIRLLKRWNGRVVLSNISDDIAKMAKIAGVFSFAGSDRRGVR